MSAPTADLSMCRISSALPRLCAVGSRPDGEGVSEGRFEGAIGSWAPARSRGVCFIPALVRGGRVIEWVLSCWAPGRGVPPRVGGSYLTSVKCCSARFIPTLGGSPAAMIAFGTTFADPCRRARSLLPAPQPPDERPDRDPVDVPDVLGEFQHDAFVLRILTVGTLCRQ